MAEPAPAPPARDDDLAAERRLLARARAAVAQGDADAALDVVAAHARRFPRGRLREERAVVRIQALVLAGRADEARDAAARFGRDHPNSLLQAVVDEAIGR
ncbi:MAG: hypothetical protein H6704_14260 [Myxococcales bacterium]|nr:hypothetical protein [Myxococcales bacterium]